MGWMTQWGHHLYPPVVCSDAVRLCRTGPCANTTTLALLWDGYKAAGPEGYQYSQYCKLYRDVLGRVDCCMRQNYAAGVKLFVGYSGQTVPLTNPETREVKLAQVFASVMGASPYTYAEATMTQSLPDWLASHVRAVRFFGGLPVIVVTENLRPAESRIRRAIRPPPRSNPRPRPQTKRQS